MDTNYPAMMFYNPRIASMKIDISINKCKLQIAIAKSINPNASGKPQAGSKVYDYDGQAFISLTPEECVKIDRAWNDILGGTYVNEDPKVDRKYAHILTLTHFSQNQPSRFSVQQTKGHGGNPAPTATIAISPTGGAQGFFFPLRVEECEIFRWFVRSCYMRLPYDIAFLDAKDRHLRKLAFDKKAQNGSGQGNYGGQEYENSPPPQYNSRPNFNDRPPVEDVPPIPEDAPQAAPPERGNQQSTQPQQNTMTPEEVPFEF